MRKFTEEALLIATHNIGKLAEISALLSPFDVIIVSAASIGLIEPVETEDSFVGNARLKAHAACRSSGLPALADDSGITIDALDGAPGVYTADWAQTPNGRDFDLAMGRAWDLLEAKQAPFPRTAQFRCTLVLAWPDGHDEVFDGMLSGQVVWPKRGHSGHGYDPVFQPDGHEQTFAEMGLSAKGLISHRAVAFRKLLNNCFT